MFKHSRLFSNIKSGIKNGCSLLCREFSVEYARPLKFKKIFMVSKLSRYEFEQKKHKNLNESELEKCLRDRGTEYEKLIKFHKLHKEFETNVVNTLRTMGFTVKIGNRFSCTEKNINEADIVMPVGGDGTFLLAASRVKDNKKPVIGFNSDPNRSEGHLCLPKKYSYNIKEAIEKLQMGNFKWLMRSRIRATILGQNNKILPKYLHDIDTDPPTIPNDCLGDKTGTILPVLALNEVFIGETLSARVSHLQMKLNGTPNITNIKCSGLCICTGTGSTSWHLSINRLPKQTVTDLLNLINFETLKDKDNLAAVLSDSYNKRLIFNADDCNLGYTIRDLISAGVWPQPKGIKSRGFASKLEVKSNCYDASLVIDGGVSFPFNDGTIALLEIKPEDSLRTVLIQD